ncbi:MAG: hypothetical protein HC830_00175 [Bacteroidetes bacterium]|nr:hypothetical protein [Bacteroidota bacterium]
MQDDQNQFYGILTPLDIFERPHKVVIDCLGKTERVDAEANFIEAYIKMINVDRYVG